MKPKILLVKASYNNFFGEAQPPLGLLYISAALKQNGYNEITLFEAEKHRETYSEKIKEIIHSFKPEIVGISAITAESISVHKISEIIKKINKNIIIIAGGAYPSHYPEFVIKDENIDFAVIGEGEKTVTELVNKVNSTNNEFKNIRGIAYRDNGKIIINEPAISVNNLDELPFPDWSLIDFDSYLNFIPQSPFLYGKRYAIILTSRGCPWRCTYCHNIFGKKFRSHSPERVIKEMELLYKNYGIENIEITDDIFNYDIQRAKTILKEKIIKIPDIKLFFVNGLRGDILDDEFIELLKPANTKYLTVALETGSKRIQKEIKKYMEIEKLYMNTKKIVSKKIFVNMFVMFNFPGEKLNDILQTIKWILKMPAHTFMPSYLMAYLNTEIAKNIEPQKLITPEKDIYIYISVKKFINYSKLKDWQMISLKILSNIIFYFFFPLRIYRIFRDMPYRDRKVLNLLFKKLITRTIFPK